MVDFYNILIGFPLIFLGLVIAIPDIKAKLNGKKCEYGLYMRGIFTGIGFIILGLTMVLRELF